MRERNEKEWKNGESFDGLAATKAFYKDSGNAGFTWSGLEQNLDVIFFSKWGARPFIAGGSHFENYSFRPPHSVRVFGRTDFAPLASPKNTAHSVR